MAEIGFDTTQVGHYQEALRYFAQAVLVAQEIGDRRILGAILNNYGEAHRALGQYAEAAQLAQRALVARTAAGDKRGIAFSLYLLGDLAWRMGNYTEAWQYSIQSRDLFAEINLLHSISHALNNLGNIACSLGDYAEARRQFCAILQPKLEQDALDLVFVTWPLVGMAEVLRQEEQPEEAIELLEQVLHHPAAWQETKDRATKLLAELQAMLPPDQFAAAQARGRAADLRGMVAQLIRAETKHRR